MNPTLADCIAHLCVCVCLSVCWFVVGLLAAVCHKLLTHNFKYFRSLNVLVSLHSTARVLHRQWGFYWGEGGRGGWEGLETPSQMYSIPPTGICLDDTNFINILIFRVRPCAYYMKGTMKRQKSIYSKFI